MKERFCSLVGAPDAEFGIQNPYGCADCIEDSFPFSVFRPLFR